VKGRTRHRLAILLFSVLHEECDMARRTRRDVLAEGEIQMVHCIN